jgi:hypothetical protein
MRPLLVSFLALGLPACHLVFPHHPGADGGGPDLAEADLPPTLCAVPDSDTLALYNFEGPDPKADLTGKHPISHFEGEVATAEGVTSCGQGLRFELRDGKPSYAVIPHNPDWDQVRSIELWARFDREIQALTRAEGILSRDARNANQPGHFTLARDCDGRIIFRLQRTGADQIVVCSATRVPADRWVRIVVGFHPAELSVDGDLELDLEPSCAPTYLSPCEKEKRDLGIEGNTLPWVLGAANVSSTDGTTDAVIDGMVGTIDELHFRPLPR